MKIYVGKSIVSLGKKNFVAQGGEGSIYVRGKTAYKIYADLHQMGPAKRVRELVAKVKELAVLDRPEIINPEKIVTTERGKPVGYTMAAVADTHPLCKVFTKAFKQRHNLDANDILTLVQGMRETMEFIHSKDVLVVDVNELNFLVRDSFDIVYFIDVDSYQTPHFPATAIMDSIRDRHSDTFDEGTDWFSWGIITFMMLTGVHPFKGKHPTIKALDARMSLNASVLGGNVKVPAICPRFEDVVPSNYLAWYRHVFEEGARVAPPVDLVAQLQLSSPVVRTIAGTNNFDIIHVSKTDAEIVWATFIGGRFAAWTTAGGSMYDRTDTDSSAVSNVQLAQQERADYPLVTWRSSDGHLRARELFAPAEIENTIQVDALMSYKGTVYLKVGEGLYELYSRRIGKKTVLSTQLRGNVMTRATRLFDGVAIQDMLGAWYASIFPNPSECYQIHLDELKGYRIVDAKFDGGVLMVLASKGGTYSKFIYQLGQDYHTRRLRIIDDAAYTDLNFATLQAGICAHILEDGVLELFHRDPRHKDIKVIQDPVVRGDMRLFSDGTTVYFFQGNQAYRIKMK
jgi:serine/threonine protein kinase